MTDLEQAFEECGEQLDRIADALKRKNPGPFVPTGFPVGVKFSDKSDPTKTLIVRWNSTSSVDMISNSLDDDFTGNLITTEDHGEYGIECTKANFRFALTNNDFSLEPYIQPPWNDTIDYQWIDPSTL